MESRKQYFAFVSYQRKDEKWADWLRSKLEHYHLPSSVRKGNPSLPKDIRPIFRDSLELSGGVLAKEIEQALINSRYLIIICSQNSAQSPWVNKEIQTFIDLGRVEYIIPFIIDGTPFAENIETECFAPALKSLRGEKELLGININEMGRDAAAIKVVARMFGLKFDTLWQRYEREQKRKRWFIIIAVLLFALVSLCVGGYIAKQNQEIKEERNRANAEREKAELANTKLLAANDSIKQQKDIALKINDELSKTNEQLVIERDNVLKANLQMVESKLRFVAEKSTKLVDDGNSYSARQVLLEAIKLSASYNLYIPEIEAAMRKAYNNESAIIRNHKGWNVFKAIFSPDERLIASCSDDEVRLFESSTGRLVHILEGHTSVINSISFSPDGLLIASSSDDKTIKIWDVRTAKLLYTFIDTSWVFSIEFSKDSKRVLSASLDSVKIWDIRSGNVIQAHSGERVATYSPDGGLVASVYKNMIKVWNPQTGSNVLHIEGHDNTINSLAFSPNGKQLCSSASGDIKVWDLSSAECLRTIVSHEMTTVTSVSYRDDGRAIISSSRDGTIRIWNVNNGKETWKKNVDTDYVWQAQFDKSAKRVLAALSDGKIIIYDLIEDDDYAKFRKDCFSLEFESNRNVDAHSICINKTGTLVAFIVRNYQTNNNELKLFDLSTKRMIYNYIGVKPFCAFSSCGNYLAFSTDDKIKIWNNSLKDEFTIGDKEVLVSIAFNANGNLISVSENEFKIWDINTGVCSRRRILHNNSFISFNESGTKMAIKDTADKIKILDVLTNKKLSIIKDLYNKSDVLKFSPNGKTLMIISLIKNAVKVFDLESGNLLCSIHDDHNMITDASYCEGGNQIAVLYSNSSVMSIFDSITGIKIFKRNKLLSKNILYCFNNRLVCPGNGLSLIIYEYLNYHDIINRTHLRFKNKGLTPEERRQYYLE